MAEARLSESQTAPRAPPAAPAAPAAAYGVWYRSLIHRLPLRNSISRTFAFTQQTDLSRHHA
jgi:hypothetical protein